MWMQLPLEVWSLIARFVQPDRLGQVCQRLRHLLGMRCAVWRCRSPADLRRMVALLTPAGPQAHCAFRRLEFEFAKNLLTEDPSGGPALAAIRHAPYLHTLVLDLRANPIGGRCCACSFAIVCVCLGLLCRPRVVFLSSQFSAFFVVLSRSPWYACVCARAVCVGSENPSGHGLRMVA